MSGSLRARAGRVCCRDGSWLRGGAAARETRMLITVIDQTNAVIPGATVTVLGAEPLTQKTEHPPVQTTPNGLATIAGLAPGRYTARAEFPGFSLACSRKCGYGQGDNRHIIVLLVENFQRPSTWRRTRRPARPIGAAMRSDRADARADGCAVGRSR